MKGNHSINHFDLENPDSIEKKYYSIGEVAEDMQVSTSLIRFWEKEFPQLKPRKTQGGTRKFSTEDVQLLKRIYHLVKVEGFTIAGAKDRLKEKMDAPADLESIKIKLTEIKQFLNELKNHLS